MKNLIVIFSVIILSYESKSQVYFRKNWLMISNEQLVINNYTSLKITGLALNNYFNTKNPYTYLLLIGDENGRNHQLIYQANFTGNLEYIGLSNSIYNQFKCAEMSTWKFNACINQTDKTTLNSIFIDEIIDCILMRINDCE
jgi:hypothetical protein